MEKLVFRKVELKLNHIIFSFDDLPGQILMSLFLFQHFLSLFTWNELKDELIIVRIGTIPRTDAFRPVKIDVEL